MEQIASGYKTFALGGISILLGILVTNGLLPPAAKALVDAHPNETFGVVLIVFGWLGVFFRMLTNKYFGLTPFTGKPLSLSEPDK